jgi:hypothetical protein
MIHVVSKDGRVFRSGPKNLGVEAELYTRYELTGGKNLTIEKWFAAEIEGPFVDALDALLGEAGTRRRRPLRIGDRRALQQIRDLGFVISGGREQVVLSPRHRSALINYLAAMLVRSPRYLTKLRNFHALSSISIGALSSDQIIKSIALDNMLSVYELYRDRFMKAHIALLRVEADRELLFSDAGIVAQEPWRSEPLPFDVHAPLTPKLAVEVLAVPEPQPEIMEVMRVNARGVSRFNRIAVGNAERFVFSRSAPPIDFIRKNFGQPAPASIGIRWKNGQLKTMWDLSRERP